MASNGKEFPLSIVIRTVDKATSGIRKIGGGLDVISRKAKRIGEASARIGKTLSTNLTLPIVAVGAASVKAMASFEDGMSNISTLVDTSTESVDDMGKSVLAIGRRTPVALDDLTSALYDTRSAGVSAGDAMGVLESSAQLGVAGLGTTAEAVDLVTSSMNAFKLEGNDADQVYDNIFKTVKNGKTTIAGLAQGFGGVAGVVADSGTELDEYLASVSALTTTGMPAAQAHTQLKAVISNLSKPSKELSKVFKKLGVKDMNTLIASSGGLVPALAKVREAVDNDSSAFKKLFKSTEASAAGLSLTGALNGKFTETLDDMREGANAVDEAFAKQNKRTSAGWKRTKNSLASAGITIGKILSPALERVAEKLQSVSQWFEGLDDGTKEWIVNIAGLVAVVGPSLIVFGKLASAFAMITKAFRVLTLAFATNPITGLALVIAAAAVSIYSNWEDFEDFFALLWDGVKSIFKDAWDYISGIIDKIVSGVKKVIDAANKVRNFVGGSWQDNIVSSVRDAKGPKLGAPLLGDANGTRDSIVPGAPAPAAAAGQVVVKFENAPPNTRVESKGKGLDLSTNTGYQMGGS